MDETSTNLNLPYLQAAQAQKHVTHNAALEQLDLIVQLVVQSFSQTTPPLAPDEGQVWAIGTGAVNDWVGHDNALAAWSNGGWLFIVPRPGWRAAMGAEIRVWSGTGWVAPDLPLLQNLPGVGVNTSYDATNKLAVASEAVLLTNTGDDMRLKVNKAAAGDTASLLFQTGFSGRAEMGALGDDNFGVKVSPDGVAWQTGLHINRTSGAAAVLAGFAIAGDTAFSIGTVTPSLAVSTGGSANALALTTGLGLTSLPVGLSLRFRAGTGNTGAATIAVDGLSAAACVTVTGAALPAGYIRSATDTIATYSGTNWVVERQVERGSNANGEFQRLQDGTQVCWNNLPSLSCTVPQGAIYMNTSLQVWSFPAVFASPPVVIGNGGTTSRFLAAAVPGTTSVAYRVLSAYSDAISYAPSAYAVGRWY